MHYLQKITLDKLRLSQPLTSTQLMPDDIEPGHFRYHLRMLVASKLIQKDADGRYALTNKGQQEVDYLTIGKQTPVRQPKIITYTFVTYGQKTLLFRKPKEPYRNLWCLIGGRVRFGEDTMQVAQRSVHEKAHIDIGTPQFCGIADIMISHDGEPLTHAHAYIYRAELAEMPPLIVPDLAVIDLSELHPRAMSPDLPAVMEYIKAGAYPFIAKIRCDY